MAKFTHIKTVAFDLDGTLIDWNGYWQNRGKELFRRDPADPGAYELRDMFNISKEEEAQAYRTFDSDYELNGMPFPHIVNAFEYLEKNGIDYMIISNRTPGTESSKNAKEWFSRNVLSKLSKADHFKGYVFNAPDTYKGEICKENKADVMVEDAPYQIGDVSINIPVIKHVTPYNETVAGRGVYPISNYRDFGKTISIIEKELGSEGGIKKIPKKLRIGILCSLLAIFSVFMAADIYKGLSIQKISENDAWIEQVATTRITDYEIECDGFNRYGLTIFYCGGDHLVKKFCLLMGSKGDMYAGGAKVYDSSYKAYAMDWIAVPKIDTEKKAIYVPYITGGN